MVSTASLTAAAIEAAQNALTEWTSNWQAEGGSHTYIEAQAVRREELYRQLKRCCRIRARYGSNSPSTTCGATLSGVDLLDTPPLVDPGEEVRGRIPQLLASFADQRFSPKEMAAEIW